MSPRPGRHTRRMTQRDAASPLRRPAGATRSRAPSRGPGSGTSPNRHPTSRAAPPGGGPPLRHRRGARLYRRRRGPGFTYRDRGWDRDPRPRGGRADPLARDPAGLDRRLDLPRPNGHLQATGRDARGRKQYRYHPVPGRARRGEVRTARRVRRALPRSGSGSIATSAGPACPARRSSRRSSGCWS